jgi:hypothetical protein
LQRVGNCPNTVCTTRIQSIIIKITFRANVEFGGMFFDAEDFSELADLVREEIARFSDDEDFEYISVYDENGDDVTDIASKYI